MTLYCKIDATTHARLTDPGELPPVLRGDRFADASRADAAVVAALTGEAGVVWWPVVDVFDPLEAWQEHGPAALEVDAENRRAVRRRPAVDRDLAALRDARKAAVKAEAGRRIVAILPEYRQRNLLAQATILLKKGEANWTPGELAAWNAGAAQWAAIKPIRDRSDAMEAEIDGLATAQAIHEYDVAAGGPLGWPG